MDVPAPSGVWLRGALDERALTALDVLADSRARPGGRVDWTEPAVALALAPVTDIIGDQRGAVARLVRVVWFAKDAGRNWGVPWHQDRIIAVAGRHDVPGFVNWSCKHGTWHCEPPVATLAAMCFVRVHLDDCDADNGAMEIACGSEAEGAVPEPLAAATAARYPGQTCRARRGDIQTLPMLVLHRSSPSGNGAPRRALRLDYAFADLPSPLAWVTA